DGMVELTRQKAIPFLAHSPLGGHSKVNRLVKDKILAPLAERRQATPHQIALAALLDVAQHVVPLIGATRIESLKSSLKALDIALDVSDRMELGVKFSFAPDSAAVSALAPAAPPAGLPTLRAGEGPSDQPEVVILMGIQGAGKSQL